MNANEGLARLQQLRSTDASLPMNDSHVLQVLRELVLEAVSDQVFSKWTETLLVCLYALVAGVGFLSNAFILTVILSSSKLRRNASSLLIANLMVGDVVMSLFCMPFTLVWFLRRSWSLGACLCRIVPLLQGLSVFLTSSSVAVIAADRATRVTGNEQRQPPLLLMAVETLAIWTLALLLALPALVWQEQVRVSWRDELEYVACIESMGRAGKLTYAAAILMCQYVVPAAVLLFASRRIRLHLRRSLASLARSTGADGRRLHLLNECRRNQKVIRTLFRLVSCFMLVWLPWNLTNLYLDALQPDMSDGLALLLVTFHLTAMTSVPLNAFLYGWSNPSIRRESRRLWHSLSGGRETRDSPIMARVQPAALAPSPRTSSSMCIQPV